MRKNIDITESTVQAINSMALNENRPVKNFIETQLEAMGTRGLSYLDLYQQYETTAQLLKQLNKGE